MTQPQTTSSLLHFAEPRREQAVCEFHGPCEKVSYPNPFEAGRWLAPKISCDACNAESAAKYEAEKERKRQDERNARVSRLLGDAWIPRRFADKSLTNYAAESAGQKRALSICKRFAENWRENRKAGTSLVFTGGPGTGKTHLACAIGSEIIREHLASAVFMTVIEAMRSIKSTYNHSSERTEADAIHALLSPDLLILDEVGVQVGSDHEKLLLFEVINGRYQECQSTILLSNLSAADLETYLGQRVMDRFRECGAVLAFDWSSHRGKAA